MESQVSQVAINAFLVRPQICVWSASKLDKEATRRTREAAGANAKAGVRVYKALVAAEALEAVKTCASAARQEHRRRTVPWSYDGPGAITAVGYPEYQTAMDGHGKEFHRLVKEFLSVYEAARDEQKANLGSLFNPFDYPPVSEVAASFSFQVTCEPMAQSADFRVAGLSQANVDAIKAGLDAQFRLSAEKGQAEAWQRVVDTVGKLQTKLREYKPADESTGEKAKGVFRDTLVDNIRSLIEVLPSLNIMKDETLTAVAVRLERELCAETAADLRANEATRNEVAEKAQAILEDIWTQRRQARGLAQAA